MTSLASRAVLVLALVLGQQAARDGNAPPRTGTAVLSGTVVTNDKDAQPIRRARITLNGDIRSEGQVATSDDNGRFIFRGIPAGRYTLQAIKPPFLPMNYGASRVERPGTPIAVADGQTIPGLTIRMTRGAAIEGRVLDQNGEPMAGATVVAMRFAFSPLTGERGLPGAGLTYSSSVASAPVPWTGNVVTDDRGVYRAFGLAPGEYVIVARAPAALLPSTGRGGAAPETRVLTTADVDRILQSQRASGPEPTAATSGAPVTWSPIYYPGTPEVAAATRITLGAGEEQSGVDISMRLVPTSRISGVVTVPAGMAPPEAQITIVSADSQTRTSSSSSNLGFVSTTRPGADGRYTFAGVTPGSFIVNARTGAGAAGRASTVQNTAGPMMWASATVVVDGRDLDVPLTLQPGIPVAGHVDFKTTTPAKPADIAAMRMSLRSVDGGPDTSYVPSAQVTEAGTFAFAGTAPGFFRFSWSKGAGPDLFLTSLTIRGREMLDGPVEIRSPIDDMTVVFTDRPSEITGTLQDTTGRPATDYFIVVFSTNRAYWTPLSRRVTQTRAGNDGKYVLRNLPAGEYFLAALTDLAPGDTSDPTFLSTLTATAAKITVTDGATTVQPLRIGG